MNVNWKRIFAFSILTMLLVCTSAHRGDAAWRTLLNEHFNQDPHNQAAAWPWNTPLQNQSCRWHYNPWNPYPKNDGPNLTQFCWGYQDAFYNNHVLQNEEFPGAIWCAYTNGSNVNAPRYPADLDYMPGQNAWVWWDSITTEHLVGGQVSFWLKNDLRNYSRDSLSAIVILDPQYITDPNIRAHAYFGAQRDENGEFVGVTTWAYGTDWVFRTYDLNDMRRLNANGTVRDSVSVIGQPFVAIGWVWQSDNSEVSGKGAFLDDIVIAAEDGLFDLQAQAMAYGYSSGPDSLYYADTPPTYLRPTYFRFDYRVNGAGRSDDFRISCYVDNQVIFSTVVSQEGSVDSLYSITTPEPWIAASGTHTVRWMLDADSTMTESSEDNNSFANSIEIPWTPASQVAVLTPPQDSTETSLNLPYRVDVEISDSNATDTRFSIFLYLLEDTVGYRDDLRKFDDVPAAAFAFNATQGRSHYAIHLDDKPDSSIWYVAAVVNDGVFENNTLSFAPGRIWITDLGVSDTPELPQSLMLSEPYPNPFNGAVTLRYTTPASGPVNLAIFDLAGRLISVVESGVQPAGNHTVTWRPVGVGAGVYLAQLEAGGASFIKKVVYTP